MIYYMVFHGGPLDGIEWQVQGLPLKYAARGVFSDDRLGSQVSYEVVYRRVACQYVKDGVKMGSYEYQPFGTAQRDIISEPLNDEDLDFDSDFHPPDDDG